MKQLIAMLDAETLLLCTACGQNEAAFETKDPQTLRAAVTVPAAESCGTKYTLAQLMDYALRYSDNTAYYMLVTKFVQSDGQGLGLSEYQHFRFLAVSGADGGVHDRCDAADVCAA